MAALSSAPTKSPARFGWVLFRFAGAAALTGLLVTFLVITRWFTASPEMDQTIREIVALPPVAPPAPEPPLQEVTEAEPPPPPKAPELPRLDFQIEQIAPPVRAVVNQQNIDLAMETTEFELETDPIAPVTTPAPTQIKSVPKSTPKVSNPAPKPAPTRTTYSSNELDGKPRLLNRPTATYPSSMLRRGVRSGKVLLEVSISPSGRCSVRRVISSTHADFSAMARSFAGKARFSVPKKDGRAVTAIYRWPLVLRP